MGECLSNCAYQEKPFLVVPSPSIIKFGYLVLLEYSLTKSNNIEFLKSKYTDYMVSKIQFCKDKTNCLEEKHLVKVVLFKVNELTGKELLLTVEILGGRVLAQLGYREIVENLDEYKPYSLEFIHKSRAKVCLPEVIDYLIGMIWTQKTFKEKQVFIELKKLF